MKKNIKNYLSLVKFSHTVFALPFAMVGFFGAVTIGGGELTLNRLLLILLCMVTARNAAMGFNRYADRKYDKLNPRTASREIPAGIINEKNAVLFVLVNVVVFIATSYFINPICFYLSPVAMFLVLGYSLAKRVTSLCHLVLGLALSVAPVGASLAVLGEFTLFPMMIGLTVIFWVSGFDILYALQDEDFDKENKLRSIPSLLGIRGALVVSALFHLIAISVVVAIGFIFAMNFLYFIGVAIFAVILVWEHIVVTPKDIKRVNLAFATLNAYASLFFAIFTVISFYI